MNLVGTPRRMYVAREGKEGYQGNVGGELCKYPIDSQQQAAENAEVVTTLAAASGVCAHRRWAFVRFNCASPPLM